MITQLPGAFLTSRWLDWAHHWDPAAGTALVGVGVAFLLLGWRLVRLFVAVSAAGLAASLLGIILQHRLASSVEFWALVLGVGAVAAPLAWLRPRLSVSVLTGVWVLAAVLALASLVNAPLVVTLPVGVGVGATVVAFGQIHFDRLVMLISALEGAVLIVLGCGVSLTAAPEAFATFRQMVRGWLGFVPLTIVALTVIGYHLQQADRHASLSRIT